VGQVDPKAGYSGGSCVTVAGASGNSPVIAPTFNAGFNLGAAKVPLPTDSFNQERAVLDGKGTGGTAVTNGELNSTVKDINKTAFPTGGTSSGVFLPYTSVGGVNTFTGGGIMVQGDANVTLSPSGATAQVYTINQGGTTTTVTIDPKLGPSGTTTVFDGTKTLTITGVPQQRDATTGLPTGYATMLFVNGNITKLTGPGQGSPAIQDATALTITAAQNVTITGDILYKAEPVTLTATKTTPIDTLIPANDTRETLGIFTATGDIQLNNSQGNGNLEIDASLAMISAGGTGGLINKGSQIQNLNIVGGRIQNQIKDINTVTRNVLYDQRYANGKFSPPWFPSTTLTPTGVTQVLFTSSVGRYQWQNKTTIY
jgi:hypothetical protein